MSDRLDVGDPKLSRNEHKSVFNFSKLMIEKLQANAYKGSWKGTRPQELMARIEGEMRELENALIRYECVEEEYLKNKHTSEFIHGYLSLRLNESRSAVAREAADVANFCLFLADVVGGLNAEEEGNDNG